MLRGFTLQTHFHDLGLLDSEFLDAAHMASFGMCFSKEAVK